MKTSKLLSLDFELVEKLKKEQNASKLVNDLVKAHFRGGQMSKEALTLAIKEKKEELALATHALKELQSQLKEMNRPKSLKERIRVG